MHIIVNLQQAARQGRKAFLKMLEDDCKATCEIVKKNMFSPIGKQQLAEIQRKLKEKK